MYFQISFVRNIFILRRHEDKNDNHLCRYRNMYRICIMRQPIVADETLLRIIHMPLELVPEMTDRRRYRPGSRIPQRADGIAFYLPLDIPQQVDITFLAFARLDILQDLLHPAGAFPAGAALSAAFMPVKTGQSERIAHHTLVLVQYNESTGAHHRPLWKTPV